MCLVNRKVHGYLCTDELNAFVYCCSNCNQEFKSGNDLEKHTFEHRNKKAKQPIEYEELLENDIQSHVASEQNSNEKNSPSKQTTTNSKNSSSACKKKKILPLHSIEREFRCTVCSAKFSKNFNLVRHMDIHTENRPTSECEVCSKQVFDLKAHMKTHTEKKFKCTLCPAQFKKTISLREHSRRHNDGSKQFICSFCEVVVFSKSEYTRHIANCTNNVPLQENTQMTNRIKIVSNRLRECILCGTKVKNLKVHLQSHSRLRPFPCTLCSLSFTQCGHRNTHIRQVHNIEPNSNEKQQQPTKNEFSCEMCDRHYDSTSDLDDHMRVHITNDRLCKICGRIVATGCITSHLRTHTGSSSKQHLLHKCKICPTSFARKEHLEEHIGFHSGIKSYKCNFCNEAFFSSAAYKRHTRTKHINDSINDATQSSAKEKILCSVCGKIISKKNIQLHMRTHRAERPHKCTVCSVAFTQKNNLVNHMRKHTGEKPYRCDPCQKSFISACALNSHKRHHIPSANTE